MLSVYWAVIVRATPLVALPLPLVVLVNETVSLYEPAARLAALELIETVIVAVAPAAKVPLLEERVTQPCVAAALQLMLALPVFCNV